MSESQAKKNEDPMSAKYVERSNFENPRNEGYLKQ